MAEPTNIFDMRTASRREARRSDEASSSRPQRIDDEEAQLSNASTAAPPQRSNSGSDDPNSETARLGITSATDGASLSSTKRSRKATEDSMSMAASPLTAGNGAYPGSRGGEEGEGESSAEIRGLEKTKKEKTATGKLFKKCTPKEPFTVRNQIQRTLFGSWLNIMLIAAPVGIALDQIKSVDRTAVFVVNFFAIVPLAALLGLATEEIALRTGETIGGLLNATFGNAVELIVAIMALADDKVTIVQTSLIGSILSNLLLVLGMCFFFGGIKRPHQNFNTTVAQTAASLLALAVASLIVPTVFDYNTETPLADVAKLSRGTSIILLLVYGGYLFFQLKTHQAVFMAKSEKVPERQKSPKEGSKKHQPGKGIGEGLIGMAPAAMMMASGKQQASDRDALRQMMLNRRMRATASRMDDANCEDEEEEPTLHFAVACALLVISTVIIAFCAEFMVDSIDAVTGDSGVKEEFVGLILLPIVGNAAEHATAITVAMKDKMDLAIGVAVGSSMQVALFLIPLLVVIGWGMGNDEMNLSFDVFQVAVLFVAVLLCNYLIADGKSHWLEGMLLVCLYAIIGTCTFWYPDKETGEAAE